MNETPEAYKAGNPTGQKSLVELLNEIESLACNCSVCKEDRGKLVKALRRAEEFIKYAQRVFPEHYQNWDTACLEELAAILTSPKNPDERTPGGGARSVA